MVKPTHGVHHYDPATRRHVVTFYPCRHQIVFEDDDLQDVIPSRHATREFSTRQAICWECHFALESPDA